MCGNIIRFQGSSSIHDVKQPLNVTFLGLLNDEGHVEAVLRRLSNTVCIVVKWKCLDHRNES
jgi:hypothetical protein